MQLRRLDEHTMVLKGLDILCCELLHQIAVSAEMDDDVVQSRLFSSPTRGAEPAIEEDWEELVHPELKSTFHSALEIVKSDLADFPSPEPAETYTLYIPVKHLEAWIHSLNQARLALAARNGFTERDMERSIPTEGDTRALALFQVHFYGFLMECFLREVDAAA